MLFVQYTGWLTGSTYTTLLRTHLSRYSRQMASRVVIQDGASYHWTASVKQWFEERIITARKLPSHSPQFNAIEPCWAWIKRRVRHASPHTHAELRDCMTEACAQLPLDVINANILHVKHNIQLEASLELPRLST
jgi:transposase